MSLQKFRNKMKEQGYDVLTVRRGLDERQDDRYPILFNLEIQSDNYMQFVSGTSVANSGSANPPDPNQMEESAATPAETPAPENQPEEA